MDPLEQARSYILTAKHGFIMELAKMGRLAEEIEKIIALIDWNEEIGSQAERIKAQQLPENRVVTNQLKDLIG
jgi:hypothetical protein